jgi:glutamyl-tRNA reductase
MTPPSLFLLGSTHKNAPLEVREKLALSNEEADTLYKELKNDPEILECVILNTCNRVEIYGVATHDEVGDKITKMLSHMHRMEPSYYRNYSFWKKGQEVVEHIFEVASGLDSQIIGENEIFGQVKKSYRTAEEYGTLGKTLNKVFQKSFQAAKWARSNTGISKGQVSLGNICVDLASRIFGKLDDSNVLVIGTGEVAEKTLEAFQSRGCISCTVTGRNLDKSKELAKTYHGTVVDFETYQNSLHRFDIVISSTAAPGLIITKNVIQKAIAKRQGLPIFLIDLAVPRDIEPETNNLETAFLYNMDDLSEIANENLNNRKEEVLSCKEALYTKADYLWQNLIQHSPDTESKNTSIDE